MTTEAAQLKAQLRKAEEQKRKYLALLKQSKERIEEQGAQIDTLKAENQELIKYKPTNESAFSMDEEMDSPMDASAAISRVCQCVRDEGDIWALLEIYSVEGSLEKKWKKFENEHELQDFVRRDSGEPLVLPPYSLSPEESSQVQQQAQDQVSQITEEFRKYRIKAEVARKQADAHIRDLQSTNVQTAKRRIEGQDVEKELELARSEHHALERLRGEFAAQEAQWKEAYDLLMAENNSLKSAGSEALLASQWRQRYEACLAEKDDLSSRLEMEIAKSDALAGARRKEDAGKYEQKYRDTKESFRLYRKKAKEIFEAQQRGDVGALLNLNESGTEDAKLSYIRNLMVNYLSSDLEVRDHMEGAIGTVLKFTPDDVARIEKKKAELESWF